MQEGRQSTGHRAQGWKAFRLAMMNTMVHLSFHRFRFFYNSMIEIALLPQRAAAELLFMQQSQRVSCKPAQSVISNHYKQTIV